MRRKPAPNSAPSIQLFPFLAVLISTMGALVVLLFAFARHGQNQAEQAAQAATASHASEDALAARETLDWQLMQLQSSRDKTERQLIDRRAELSHVEDHLRRLRSEAEEIELAIEQLAAAKDDRQRDPDRLEQRRQKVLRQIEQIQSELEQRELQRLSRPVTYSVVPYHGPNSTNRRPIYIECTDQSVIVQPEGLVLTEADFQPPLGPGNPLAAAIRAYGEYLNRLGLIDQETKPYPMLLVRPNGIGAYYAARGALVSWGTEFGYELVGGDWTLDFPVPDPQLATTLQAVIADARMRQQVLAAAAPRQFSRSRSSGGGLRASPNGRGFVREGGGDEPATGFGGRAGQGGSGTRGGFGGGGYQPGDPPTDQLSASAAEGSGRSFGGGTGGQYGTEPEAGQLSAGPALAEGGGSFNSGTSGGLTNSGGGRYGESQGGTAGTGDMAGQSAGENRSGNGGEPGTGSAGQGQSAGKPGQQSGASSLAGNSSANLGNGSSNGSSSASSSAGAAGAASGSAGGGASGGNPQDAGGIPQVALNAPRNTPNRSTQRRGEDWGLPDATRGLIPVTRPVIVRCEANRLVLLPDDNRTDPRPIAVPERSEVVVDELISSVWDHIKSWGTAGRGMYWKPMLVFDVAPGGEARYADFAALLAGSGIEVKQRNRSAAQPTATTPTRR